jgi:hypothetical protein
MKNLCSDFSSNSSDSLFDDSSDFNSESESFSIRLQFIFSDLIINNLRVNLIKIIYKFLIILRQFHHFVKNIRHQLMNFQLLCRIINVNKFKFKIIKQIHKFLKVINNRKLILK